MSELQPGMLALVVGCRFKENSSVIGSVVTLRDSFISNDGVMWRAYEWLCDEADNIQAKYLMPLPPLADPLHEKQQQELHA